MSKKDGASKRLAETRRDRDSSDYAAAMKLRQSKWEPPKTPALSALEQRRRLPLMSVVNLLAFNVPDSLPDTPPLILREHWRQAFRALCAAAGEGEVKLFGTPWGGGPRCQIDDVAFDEVFSLGDEPGTISHDLDEATTDRFVELRQSRDRWVWSNVHVDRASLVDWLEKSAEAILIPKSAGPRGGRPSVMDKIRAELNRWIDGRTQRLKSELAHWTPTETWWSKARIARALAAWCAARGGNVKSPTIVNALPSELDKARELL
jgi:hypothetical protein